MTLPFLGVESEQLIRNMKSKLYHIFKSPKDVKYNVQLKTTKLSMFNSNKDKIPFLSKSKLVYEYQCPGCASTYIGKTESTLFRRTREHAWSQKDSAIYKHFANCQHYQELFALVHFTRRLVNL